MTSLLSVAGYLKEAEQEYHGSTRCERKDDLSSGLHITVLMEVRTTNTHLQLLSVQSLVVQP